MPDSAPVGKRLAICAPRGEKRGRRVRHRATWWWPRWPS